MEKRSTKKRKSQFNFKLKALFDEYKKLSGVTAVRIAEELEVSVQTVTNMSGRLDEISIVKLEKLATMFDIDLSEFCYQILERTDLIEGA